MSPVIIDVRLKPGESAVQLIHITAGSGAPLHLRFEHADFGFDPSTYAVQLIEDSATDTVDFSTREWLSIPEKTVDVAPGRSVDVKLTIAAPDDARPGTHLGAALFRTIPDPNATGQVITSARSGPLVFVAIDGGSRGKPALKRFDVPGYATHGPIRPEITLANTGSVHYKASGTMTLRGIGVSRRIKLPSKYVFPGLPRRLRPATGDSFTLGARSLPPGRYVVTVDMIAKPDNIRIRDSRVVWIIPWWALILAGLALACIAAGSALAWRRIQHRRLEQYLRDEDFEDEDFDDEDFDDEDADDASEDEFDDVPEADVTPQ